MNNNNNNKNYHRVNDINDLEPVHPVEVAEYPGFFYFPDNKDLAVSYNSKILNLRTGKILIQRPDVLDKCYIYFSKPGEKTKAYLSHRVIGITLIGRPSRHLDKEYDELEINHIDGNRLNNSLSNLEWVTGKENAIHSHLSGFNPRDKPVIAKNVLTGRIKYFTNSKNCADSFGIHRATFWKHLESGNSGKFHKDMYVFKYEDNTQWNIIETSDLKILGDSNSAKSVFVQSFKDGSKIIFESIKHASKYLNIPHVTLWRRLKKDNELIINNFKISLF